MGEVVELWSIGTFRATFLIEEWQRLADRFQGDYDKAARAHSSLCRDWEQIWDATAPNRTEAQEHCIGQLNDKELLHQWQGVEIESPLADLIAGEMERRNLGD